MTKGSLDLQMPPPSAGGNRGTGTGIVAGQRLNLINMISFHPSDDVAGDVRRVEMVAPFLRPYGCGPVAPSDWVVLRTYQRILEVRDEIRMDDTGLTIGDRTFKRCYQRAMRKLQDRAGNRAIESIGLPDRARHIEAAFLGMRDKLWHRYLFPFGTFFFDASQANQGRSERLWKEQMHKAAKDHANVINPYSVAAADVLYLCNTGGYLERFVYLLGIILWAKRNGFNLLHHRRPTRSEDSVSKMDLFYTLEKHLHVFGSIWLHVHVMQTNKHDVGGNWNDMLQMLEHLNVDLMGEFGVDKNLCHSRVKDMTVEKINGSLNTLQNFFPKANRVSC